LFERGRNFERGRSPLSLTLPSPAININEFLPMFPTGEGLTLKVLPEGTGGEVITYQPNANRTFGIITLQRRPTLL